MGHAARQPLRAFYAWLFIGGSFVLWVVYQSLTPSPIQTPGIEFGDKLGHFFAYFLMMAWFVQMYTRRRHFALLVLFISLGIAIEVLQGQTSYRRFEYADMVANGLGVVAAWFWARPAFGFAGLLLHAERAVVTFIHQPRG